jgi:hypothetical protein
MKRSKHNVCIKGELWAFKTEEKMSSWWNDIQSLVKKCRILALYFFPKFPITCCWRPEVCDYIIMRSVLCAMRWTWTLDLYIDVFWYGVIQRGRSPFVRIALPSSLMLWLKVYRQMELAYYPWFVLGHLVAARFNLYQPTDMTDLAQEPLSNFPFHSRFGSNSTIMH